MDQYKTIINEVLGKRINSNAEKFICTSDLIVEKACTNYAKSYLTVGEPIAHYYASIHASISANPSKQSTIDALNAIYIKYASDIDVNRNDIINSPMGFKSFCETLTFNSNIKTIFIKGSRGTGKTTLINYLANNFTRFLESEKKVLWFRVDVTKIYDEWKTSNDKEGNYQQITLRDYLAIQIPFVVCKYQHTSEAFGKIAKKAFTRKVLQRINNACKTRGSNFNKYDVRELLQLNDKSISHTPSEQIINFATNQGYKVCIIIDGIDNIDFRLYRNDYEKFLDQFLDIFQSGRKENYIDKYIVSFRQETYDHLKLKKPPFFVKNDYKCFHVVPVSIPELLAKKAEVAKKPVGKFCSIKDEEAINKSIQERIAEENYLKKFNSFSKFDDAFIEYSRNYVDDLIATLNDILPFENPINTYQQILTYIASGNIRDFVINFVNSWRMKLLFEKYGREVSETARVIESLLLNGRNYIHSSSQISESPAGYLLPNIFWFNANESEGKWHGLCGLRILQYLKTPYSTEKEKLVQNLRSNFGYKDKIIYERLNTFLKNGLVTFDKDIETKSILYKITEKGNLMMNLYFYNIDIFYFVGLDTPLVSSPSQSNGGIFDSVNSAEISWHTMENNEYWKNYLSSAIITSITLLRHLRTYNQIELGNVKPELLEYFRFDDKFDQLLIKGIENKLRSFSEKSKNNYEELISNLKGIRGY